MGVKPLGTNKVIKEELQIEDQLRKVDRVSELMDFYNNYK